ncbi:exonuclease [Microbacterium phage Redfield]|uniref:Exonuclease n=1 Tax=Microbacterium phage Redfield TaxID=2250399 RepID=A0A345KTS5_9CAUD|nr:exonuclease [Microbacterium phage Redfield]
MPSSKGKATRLPSTGLKPGSPLRKFRGKWPTTDDGKLVITQSMVSGFVECHREVYYSIVLGLRPRLEKKPLTRGTWVHSLLEERANGRDWRAKHAEIKEKSEKEQFEEEVQGLEREVWRIMSSYEYVYAKDNLTPIAAEITVERPMFGGKVLYRGRIDLVVIDEHGDVWLVDHKTHAQIPEWRYRELAFQHYSYLWACETAPEYKKLRYKGKPLPQPKGFIYDYAKTGSISVPSLTLKGKISRVLKPTGTTLPVFKEWLQEQGMMTVIRGKELLAIEDEEEREYVKDFLIALKQRDYSDLFRRDRMEFSPEQRARQHKAFVTSARRLLNYTWDDPDCVERNLHACSGYMCNYKDLTIADLIHGTSEIEQRTRYTTTRDPLDYYPNQKKGKKK